MEWIDDSTFKLELEEQSLNDDGMQEWCQWMDRQLQLTFPNGAHRNLVAAKMNFARNEIGDDGVKILVAYLLRKNISVHQLKLYRNAISDVGAAKIGELVAHSSLAPREVHLSYNCIGDRGAVDLLQAIAKSSRYPCTNERSGDQRLPLWMRLEYNYINWHRINKQLDEVKWMSAESRESQAAKDSKAAICLHYSFRNQNPLSPGMDLGYGGAWWEKGQGRSRGGWEQGRDGWQHGERDRDHRGNQKGGAMHDASPAWARDQEGPAGLSLAEISAASFAHHRARDAVVPPPPRPEEAPRPDDVPLYVFMDASAVNCFIEREDSLFSFHGLLNLCEQRLMRTKPSKTDDVEEKEMIVFTVTNLALEELAEQLQESGERSKVESMRDDPSSHMNQCHRLGVVDILDTSPHSQLKKLTRAHEEAASDMGISSRMVRLIDFACIWESKIEVEGRVLFMVAEEELYKYAKSVCNSFGRRRGISVVDLRELDEKFAVDVRHGGQQLSLAAAKAARGCSSIFQASVLKGISGELIARTGGRGTEHPLVPVKTMRTELQEALQIAAATKQLLSPQGMPPRDEEVALCLEYIQQAESRWHQILSQ